MRRPKPATPWLRRWKSPRRPSLNPKGSVLFSWALGLVGIACAVSAVYLYLDRLGGRED